MSSEEFWRSTPAQLAAIGRRFDYRRDREEFGPALICSTVCQIMGGKQTVEDFMPSRRLEKKKSEESPEQFVAMVHFLKNRFGGEIVSTS